MFFNQWSPHINEFYTLLIIFTSITFFILASYYTLNKELISPELNRRLVHVAIGIIISFSPYMFNYKFYPSLLAIIFICINTIAFKTKAFEGIHSQKRKSYGTIYFPLSYLIIISFFWEHSYFIMFSLLILTFSDPLAAQIGSKKKSLWKFKIWHDYKTIEGTIAFFISNLLILAIGTYYFMDHNLPYLLGFVFITSVFTTISEITSKMGTDNLSIPLVSILIMIGLNNQFSENPNNIHIANTVFLIIIMCIILFFTYRIKSLSPSGYFGSIIMGTIIILFGKLFHFGLLALFFILSSLLNIILKKYSFNKHSKSNRKIEQVFCNGGVPLLICIHEFFNPNPTNIYLYSASISAAMADTWGTEFGKLSKSKPISIISFKTINHGLSGGITRIGTIGSLLGACIIGLIVWLSTDSEEFLIFGIIIIGFLSAIIDSIIGDKFQGKHQTPEGDIVEEPRLDTSLISGYYHINNNLVNLIATISAPILMYLFIKILN